jgi:hypothetical protein
VRPLLKPALRRLWRGDTAVQYGADPRCGLVLHGVDDRADRMLALLDGTRSRAELLAAAAATGVPAPEAAALLDTLAAAYAIDDAAAAPHGLAAAARARLEPDLATLTLLTTQPGDAARALDDRRAACVLLVGAGRVGALAGSLLGAAGIGRLVIRDEETATPADAVPGGVSPRDDGTPRAVAAVAAAERAGAASVDGEPRLPDEDDCRTADLAVVASDGWLTPAPALLELFGSTGVPYLLTGVRETYGVVGPLVLPGRTSCPRCHDLHRAGRDPGWPAIAAQLATRARNVEPACDVTLAAGVAALTAGQVLAHLIGPGLTRCVDGTLELRLPEWVVRRRAWAPHEECECGAAEYAAAQAAAARAAELAAAVAEHDYAARHTGRAAARRAHPSAGSAAPTSASAAAAAAASAARSAARAAETEAELVDRRAAVVSGADPASPTSPARRGAGSAPSGSAR